MATPHSSLSKRTKNVAVSLLAAFFVIGGSFVFYKMFSHTPPNKSKGSSVASTLKPASNNTLVSNSSNGVQQASVLSLPTKNGLGSYVSQTNKLGFYFSKQGSDQYGAVESGNKVSVKDTSTGKEVAFMQIFQKSPSDTIQQAITKAVLSGYNPQDCPISIGNFTSHSSLPKNVQTAQVSYNANNRPSYGAGIGDDTKCPHQYTLDEDDPYFLVDSNHPDKLIFFFNDQIVVSAGNDSNGNPLIWSDTFTFAN